MTSRQTPPGSGATALGDFRACAMVRGSLAADAPYVDVAVHGDGLIEMQYRRSSGDITLAARTPIGAPAGVRLERDGDVFTASVARPGQPFQPVGAVALALPDPVHVGLAVCSHNAGTVETAVIRNVRLTNRVAAAGEARVQETSLERASSRGSTGCRPAAGRRAW